MEMRFIETTFVNGERQTEEKRLPFVPDKGEENQLINLYPQMQYQELEGFGGALTDSTGYIFGQMGVEQQEYMLNQYFGEDDMGYRIVRIPIDSCDFSLEHYEALTDPKDTELERLDFTRMKKYIVPLLEEVQKYTKERLQIMLSPWSPPAFMKTNGDRNHGGKLKDAYKELWARYICRYIQEFRDMGYLVNRLSIQNEPKAVQTWDSCIYSGKEEKEFIRDYMWPALVKYGLADVEIFIWDHNKERVFERVLEIIDEGTDPMIAGIAFHWYSGDHFEALQMIQEKFPDKKLILSEACIEYSKYSQDDYLANAQKYAHDMIGNLNHGMSAFYDWNVVLDQQGGPNHVGNYCDAPFLFDVNTKELIERNTAAYIWHFSHFIKSGAKRIGHSRYTDKLEVTAFLNPDQTVTVVILNRTDNCIPAYVRIGDESAFVSIQANSIATGVLL